MPILSGLIHASLLVQEAVTDCLECGGTAGAGTRILPLGPVDPYVRNPLNELVATVSVWVTRHLLAVGSPNRVGFRYRLIPQSESKSPRQARAPVGTQARSAWLPFSTSPDSHGQRLGDPSPAGHGNFHRGNDHSTWLPM